MNSSAKPQSRQAGPAEPAGAAGAPARPTGGALDTGRLAAWLAAEIPAVSAPVSATLVTGGRSNLTYVIGCAGGERIVLRHPPAGRATGGAHDVLREHRILTALRGTGVPVPAPLRACADPEVLGVPFYVMEHVDGEVLAGAAQAEAYPPDRRWRLGIDLIEVLARLHSVVPAEAGLGSLSPPGDYAQRQLHRWTRQWENYQTRDLPALTEATRLLRAATPVAVPAALVHHDYRLGNVIAGPDCVRAVLDWELAALGDPMADLAYLWVRIAVPASVLAPHGEPLGLPGFPAFDELLAAYDQVGGGPVRDLGFHKALAALRWAVIAEGIYLRFARGAMGAQDADLAFLRDRVATLAEFTLRCAQNAA